MHFSTKSYLKSTRNHTAKHALNVDHNLSVYDLILLRGTNEELIQAPQIRLSHKKRVFFKFFSKLFYYHLK